jgi:AcrR family transcriptional regulator
MGINERNQKMLDIKKEEIINGMEKALKSKSYESLTIEDVAREAEYSKKTIYSYFKSKDQIYLELLVKKFEVMNEILENAVKSTGSKGIDKLKVIGDAYYGFARDYPEYLQAIISYDTNRGLSDSDTSETLNKFNSITEKSLLIVVRTIEECINEGAIKKDIDPFNTAIMLWSSLNGLIMLEIKKGDYIYKEYGRKMKDLYDYSYGLFLKALI